MKRLITIMVLAIAGLSAAFGQTAAGKPKQPASVYEYEPIRKGDQYISLSAGPEFALFYIAPSGINTATKLNLGGMFEIGYSQFITSHLALGGEINFGFHSTLGENIYFYLPLLFKTTYVFIAGRFQFPVSLGVGGAFETYDSKNYFGPVLKPEIGAYYQYSNEWSFGITAGYTMVPQWYTNSSYNRTGNFLGINAGFRYHF